MCPVEHSQESHKDIFLSLYESEVFILTPVHVACRSHKYGSINLVIYIYIYVFFFFCSLHNGSNVLLSEDLAQEQTRLAKLGCQEWLLGMGSRWMATKLQSHYPIYGHWSCFHVPNPIQRTKNLCPNSGILILLHTTSCHCPLLIQQRTINISN